MKQSALSYGIIFVVVVSTAFCSGDGADVTPSSLNGDAYQKLLDSFSNNKKLRINCEPFYINGNHYCPCSKVCRIFFYLCFGEGGHWERVWIERCSKRFRTMSQRVFIAPKDFERSSSFYKFRVEPAKTPFWTNSFSISNDTCSCSAGYGGKYGTGFNSSKDWYDNMTWFEDQENCELKRRQRERHPNWTCDQHSQCSCNNNNLEEPRELTLSEKPMVQFCTYLAEEIDVKDENALQNVTSLLKTIIQDFKNAYSNTASTDEDEVQLIRETAHFTTTAFEDFVVRFAKEQLSDANPQSNVTDRVDAKVRRVFNHNKEEFRLSDTGGGNSIMIPVENFVNNDSVVLGVMYKDLHELFMTNRTNKSKTTKKNREPNTIIMSAAIYPPTEALNKSITLVFKNIKPAGNRRECVHWNYSENNSEGWSGKGCNTTSINSSQTVCVCNHLTHFAVLMDYDDDDDDDDSDSSVLIILTYVGVALSLLGAVITIICYLLLTDKHAPLSQIRVSLVASLAAGQITFLAGIDATDNKGACVTAAALMQYFFMAAFCWMLVEGIYLYLFVVKVYNVSHKMSVYHGMSWGIPAVVVAITLSFAAGKGVESYVGDKYCWLSSSNDLIWIFVSFVLLIELVNVMILVRVIREMASMQHVKDQQSEQIKLSIRACVMLIPLLGVTWLIGLLAPLHKAFVHYIFVILNSTQIRERFMRRIRRLDPVDEISTSRAKKTLQANQSTVNEVDPSNIGPVDEISTSRAKKTSQANQSTVNEVDPSNIFELQENM